MTVFNRLDAYSEVGKRVAEATNDGDGARAAFERRYFQDMFLCEAPGDDRLAARKAYDAAFRVARKFQRIASA